ncbi:MAG TPA: stage III sporulation protein AE [Ruminococcaceae bacterium]|jgi:stage III sporulation protein AE|nr:stage III sporulation protein AE [Oscillospiraceae bacterium]HBT90614.1 stage III sporulation protein AE [Oscillospiraceae bacterium]HCB91079.1 stage III sporulation protein AE [Oscillospiraceae bacterium]
MKKAVLILLVAAAFFSVSFPAAAKEAPETQDYYEEQLEASGADDLPDKLPEETRKILDGLGVDGVDGGSILSVTPQGYFEKILDIFTGKAGPPLRVFAAVTAVILLCALLNGMKLSFGEKPMGGVIDMTGTLCICAIVVAPIVSCIADAAEMLKAACGFLLACVPVLVAVMAAAGQAASAGAYHLLMVAAGNILSAFSAEILAPLMNIFLALSIVSAVSPNVNLGGLCGVLNKVAKWVMGLGMTLFTGLVTMHSFVATSVDGTGAKAAKFVVSSFVPVVGNALGEALNTVGGCIRTLKSGVGAFGLLAGIFIFLPVLAECLLWMLTLAVCAGISQIFGMQSITALLKASSDVVSTMLAVLLCSMMVLIISTVVMMTIGGVS